MPDAELWESTRPAQSGQSLTVDDEGWIRYPVSELSAIVVALEEDRLSLRGAAATSGEELQRLINSKAVASSSRHEHGETVGRSKRHLAYEFPEGMPAEVRSEIAASGHMSDGCGYSVQGKISKGKLLYREVVAERPSTCERIVMELLVDDSEVGAALRAVADIAESPQASTFQSDAKGAFASTNSTNYDGSFCPNDDPDVTPWGNANYNSAFNKVLYIDPVCIVITSATQNIFWRTGVNPASLFFEFSDIYTFDVQGHAIEEFELLLGSGASWNGPGGDIVRPVNNQLEIRTSNSTC